MASTTLVVGAVDRGTPVDAALYDTVCALAGTDANGPLVPSTSGPTAQAVFSKPTATAIDADGTVYVLNSGSFASVVALRPDGSVQPIAGTGNSGSDTGDGGPALAASIGPSDVMALDTVNRLLYVGGYVGFTIRRIDLQTGIITTVAGGGTDVLGNGIPATQAAIRAFSMAVGPDGNLYLDSFASSGADTLVAVRRVDRVTGTITTVAGGVGAAVVDDDFTPATSGFVGLGDIAFGPDGSLYVASSLGGVVQKVEPAPGFDYANGRVTRVAGQPPYTWDDTGDGGPATAATLPQGIGAIAVDADNNLYIDGLGRIRRVDLDTGIIDTIAGQSTGALRDGTGDVATFLRIGDIATGIVDGQPGLIVTDQLNHRVRLVRPGASAASTTVSTFAGTGPTGLQPNGTPALAAGFGGVRDVAYDAAGNLYVADGFVPVIRRIATDGTISVVAGTGRAPLSDSHLLPLAPAPATSTPMFAVRSIAFDGSDPTRLYFATNGGYEIGVLDLDAGTVQRVAGNGSVADTGDGGPATSAGMYPTAIASDADGNVYVSSLFNGSIRRIDRATGVITRVAGNGTPGNQRPADGSSAQSASVYMVARAVVGDQIIVIGSSQSGPNASQAYIGQIDRTTGTFRTIAATGSWASTGTALTSPGDLRADATGRLYVLDRGGSFPLYRLTPANPPTSATRFVNGTVELLAPRLAAPTDTAVDGLPVSEARIIGAAFDVGPDGDIAVIDSNNPDAPFSFENRIRLLSTNGCQSLRVTAPAAGTLTTPNGVVLGDIPVENLPLGATDATTTTLRNIDLRANAVRVSPLRQLPLRQLPLRQLPLRQLPLRQLPLRQLPLARPGGWDALLVGTPFEGLPLEQVTLEDVIDLPATATVSIGELDLSSTRLQSISVSSVLLGATPLRQLRLDPGVTDTDAARYADWVSRLSALGFDANALFGPDAPVLALDIESVPLRQLPLRQLPLRQLVLADAPLRQLPLRQLDLSVSPLRQLPLRQLDLASSPLRQLPLRQLPLRQLVVDCGRVDCESTTLTLGDVYALDPTIILATATFGDLWGTDGAALGTLTVDDLIRWYVEPAGGYVPTFGDLLLAILGRDGLPWEQFRLDSLQLETLPGLVNATGQPQVDVGFDVYPDGVDQAISVTADLGRLGLGSAFAITDALPTTKTVAIAPNGHRIVTWTIAPDVIAASNTPRRVTLSFGVVGGTIAGPQSVAVTVSPTTANAAPTTVTVDVGVDGGDTGSTPVPITADRLYLGQLATPGDLDLYTLPIPAQAGAVTTIDLSSLPVDADLVVYESGTPVLRGTGADLRPIVRMDDPLPVPDGQLRTTDDVSTPALGQDVPIDPSVGLAATSTNRGTANERVVLVSRGQPGSYVIQVNGYRNATSADSYVLRARQVVPPGVGTCPALPAPVAGTRTLSLPTTLATATDTLLLVSEQRLLDVYGQAGHDQVVTAVNRMVNATTLGYRAQAIPVDRDPAVAAAITAWRNDPCNVGAANAIVGAINSLVDRLVPPARRATMKNIVIVGGDDQIPFARLTDATKVANESTYAGDVARRTGSTTAASPISQALGARTYLSDDPYASFTPLTWGTEVVYSPDVSIGRLVETPADIAAQVTQFLATLPGTTGPARLNPTSSVVLGYDFLADAAVATDAAIGAARGTTISRTVDSSDVWTATTLEGYLGLSTAAAPGLLAINAHFDHEAILPAAGNNPTVPNDQELVTTADVRTSSASYAGRLFFSIGCHSGLAVPDGYVGPDGRAADWAQTLASRQAIWVANTGFGYGDDATIAYSEQLAIDFARNLDGTLTAGEALRYAKQKYRGTELREVYDLKAMQELTFYGIPMYRLGNGTVPTPDPGVATTADPAANNLESYTVTVSPTPQAKIGPGATTFYQDGASTPLVADGRPLQPETTVDVTPQSPTLEPRGAVVTAATESTQTVIDVTVAKAVTDDADLEPPLPPAADTFPASFQDVATYQAPGGAGERANLLLTVGRFTTDTSPATANRGTQTLFSSMTASVYYAPLTDTDRIQPTITNVASTGTTGQVSIRADVTDRTATAAGTIARVVVLYRDGSQWRSADLIREGQSSSYSRTVAAAGAQVEFLIQAVDGSGNVGVSSNKAVLFTAPAAPPAAGTPATPVVVAGADVSGTAPLTVSRTVSVVDSDSTTFTATVDNGTGPAPLTIVNGQATLSRTFTTAGTYRVSIRVCDEGNRCGTDSFRVFVAATTAAQAIVPVMECQVRVGLLRFAFWSYDNPNSVAVSIPVGTRNRFAPLPQNRLQPTRFAPGKHRFVLVTLQLSTQSLVWTLDGRSATSDSASASCRR
jgi:hypothetical protein